MKKAQTISAIIINSFIFVSVFTVILILAFSTGDGPHENPLGQTFKFFTNLSNMYCALICLVTVIAEIRILSGKQREIPHWLLVLKQTGTVAVAITFVTVLFFLAPMAGKRWYTCYQNTMFFVHFLNPLLAMICFVFLEKEKPLSLKEDLFALIPFLTYAVVYIFEVLYFKNWEDFYGFTFGGKAWAPLVVLPVLGGVAFFLSFMLSFLQKKVQNRHSSE